MNLLQKCVMIPWYTEEKSFCTTAGFSDEDMATIATAVVDEVVMVVEGVVTTVVLSKYSTLKHFAAILAKGGRFEHKKNALKLFLDVDT